MQPSDTGVYTCEVFSPQSDAGQSQKSVIVSVLGKRLSPLLSIVAFFPYHETLNSRLKLRRTRGNKRAVINKAHDAEKGLSDALTQRFFARAVEAGRAWAAL